ncbi:DUF5753 domain-containing protein [Allokutzneria sp. A3M-2-11 16]|uniref:DUF5753 domain-containing protein n=1 Tax=Allokutzneria sp. A3M-2-11 16 TaxID=2962043 RepID=UPI0020B88EE9|nr:DUF5753 domain-containing protein [Allokutzneria sp. A3M-2-11 16]MCP3803525.1 DUF5753 domain-containing protein [Allokutzneria sp. A3M-2-11 16]
MERKILQDLRKARGLVQKAVGEQAFAKKMSQKFVCDLESGKIDNAALPRYVADLKVFFGVDPGTAAMMDRLCQTPTTMREWRGEHESVPTYFRYFMAQEIWAVAILQWQDNRIPGLIQAPGYMRALFAEDHDPEKAEALAAARLGRQRLFEQEDPPRYEVVLHENAVRRLHRAFEAAIATEQLLHIVALMEKFPSVTVRILTRDGEFPDLPQGFAVMRFPDAHGDCVYVEPSGRGDYEDDESYVDDNARDFDRLRDAALSRDESVELMLRLAG